MHQHKKKTYLYFSGGIGSGIFSNDPLAQMSYRIDEEEMIDADDDNHQEKKDLNILNAVVTDYPSNGNQTRLINLKGNSSSTSSSQNNLTDQRQDSIAITVQDEKPDSDSPNRDYVGLQPQEKLQQQTPVPVLNNQGRNEANKRSFLKHFYNPKNSTNSSNHDTDDEHDDLRPITGNSSNKNNIKMTPTRYLSKNIKKDENDEELRPLSNGYLVQNS